MRRLKPDLHSLSAQLILSFVALVLLTAAAAGLPALWLVHDQLDRQAWSQVEQASLASQSLYSARIDELGDLATLTAQRPSLRALLVVGQSGALQSYLTTLLEGGGLDLLLVCDTDGRAVAQTGESTQGDLCAVRPAAGFLVTDNDQSPQAWLYATSPIPRDESGELGIVLAGIHLDNLFADQMHLQTGLEHTLLVRGQIAATSLPTRRQLPADLFYDSSRSRFTLGDESYYATRLALDGAALQAELALQVTGIAAAERRLVWTLLGSITAVAAVALLLGVLLARRIARPLAHLAEATTAMSAGILDNPLTVETRVREVTLLTQALEGARADLKRTLAQLLREKAWTDHLLEAIAEGIVTLDRQGRITFFSQGAEQITGWKRDEVLGRSCDRVFTAVETEAPFSELIPAPGRSHKIAVEARDGEQTILAVTGARLLPPEAGEARVALVFRDVSEEEAVHRLLGHFLANVAHEFRTPLSALAASVELLLDQATDLSPSELGELMGSLHLGVLGLQNLIDNLLESASIETGHFRVHTRPTDLGDVVHEATSTMQPLLARHGQRLLVRLPGSIPLVQADPRRTGQVLTNLLSNASKYGPDNAEIEVQAMVRPEWVQIAVSDRGPGVPPQHRKELFRRFRRVNVNSGQAPLGAGLGLSVVKAIVDAQGGEAGVDDRPGGGSVFWFTLPVTGGQSAQGGDSAT